MFNRNPRETDGKHPSVFSRKGLESSFHKSLSNGELYDSLRVIHISKSMPLLEPSEHQTDQRPLSIACHNSSNALKKLAKINSKSSLMTKENTDPTPDTKPGTPLEIEMDDPCPSQLSDEVLQAKFREMFSPKNSSNSLLSSGSANSIAFLYKLGEDNKKAIDDAQRGSLDSTPVQDGPSRSETPFSF